MTFEKESDNHSIIFVECMNEPGRVIHGFDLKENILDRRNRIYEGSELGMTKAYPKTRKNLVEWRNSEERRGSMRKSEVTKAL